MYHFLIFLLFSDVIIKGTNEKRIAIVLSIKRIWIKLSEFKLIKSVDPIINNSLNPRDAGVILMRLENTEIEL